MRKLMGTRWVVAKLFGLMVVVAWLSACIKIPPQTYLNSEYATKDAYFASVPPPPFEKSEEHKAELALVLKAQQNATKEEKKRAESEFELNPDAFRSAIGPWFVSAELPATTSLLTRAMAESKPTYGSLKEYYQRPRPPMGNKNIKPLDGKNFDDLSYPSGHSFRGTLWGLILADLIPDKAEAIIMRSQEIGWDRVIAGMHHPSDIYAGRVVAYMVYRNMKNSEAFKVDMETARQELAGHQ